MNLLSKLSIRRKLMLIVMVTSSAAGLLACTTFISYDLHVFRQTKLNQLVALADVIGANTTGALAFDDVGSATQTLRALRATPHVVSAAIYDVYGRRFATYRRDSAGKQQGFPIVPEERNRFSKDSVAVFRPIWLDGEKAGMVYVAADLVDVHERLVRYAGIVTLVAMGCLVIVYLLASRLQRSISEPILDLSNVMQSVANEKNSFLRATKHADDEIGRLADGFNHMLQQIELRENDLREARNSLEKRVEERTRELKEEIEERRRTEQALGQSEETTRLLLDSTAEAIYGVGMQGECTFANPSCLRMLGYEDAGDLLGKNLHELIHHTRADGTPYLMKECKLQEAFRLGVQRHVDDEVFWRRDGRSFPVEYWSHPILSGKQIAGAVVTFLDITHRRNTEKELEERTSFLNTVIEVSPLAIVVEDLKPRIQLCNPAFEKLFGYSGQEAREHSIINLLFTPEMHAEAEEIRGHIQSGEAIHRIAQRRRHDGSLVDVEIHGAPLFVRGKLVGQFALYQDITERKKAETDLRAAKEAAESASRAKSEFLANMSHEIRTPMNGVIGMTDLVLDTELNSEQREYLGLVRSSADALLGVINDILDFSKIEARHLELEHTPFQLRETLGDTLKTLAVRAHQKGLELAFEVAPEVPEVLVGDPLRLRQILVNIVGNGIKFTESGEVVVQVTRGPEHPGEAELHFSVRDTGIGIPKEKQKSIFEAFSQVDSSTTRKYGGTGLGLTITARLVELMGGGIRVESEPGHGSIFHFTVKFRLAEDAEWKSPPSSEVLHGVSALVVDDNATNRRILGAMLKNWGMRPILANGGAAALAEVARARKTRENIRVVILDCHMPEMDGFELAERLWQDPGFETTLVMMVTSGGQKGDVKRCRDLGITRLLVKPVEQKLLFDSILQLFGRTSSEEEPMRPLVNSADHSISTPLRVLIVEDNLVNQKVATRLLEKRGHRVVLAGNGREALEALHCESFDVVLMDVQMPEMGGYEATQLIRKSEKVTGGHMPIIAMTAHALKGDREKCLEAGMDGFVSKPIHPESLFEELSKHKISTPEPARTEPVGPVSAPRIGVIDGPDLLNRVGGDAELLTELLSVFRVDCRLQLHVLHEAIAAGEAEAVERRAHCLKGTLANLAAVRGRELAGELEQMGRSRSLEGAAEKSAELEQEITLVEQALAELCQEVVK